MSYKRQCIFFKYTCIHLKEHMNEAFDYHELICRLFGQSFLSLHRFVYVDEHTCIGCTMCATTARSTFFLEDTWGRARVYQQQVR